MRRWLASLRCRWCSAHVFRCECGKGGGGGTTTVTTVIPGPSDEERALQRKQVELLELQIGEARRQSKLLEESFPQSGALLKEQLELTRELASFQRAQLVRQESLEKQLLEAVKPVPETAEQKEIRDLSEKRALAILRGDAPVLSPQQSELIETTFTSAEEEAQTSLRQFGEELAASRGLRLTDAPIGAEIARAGTALASSLASSKAGAKLEAGRTQQLFQENVRQFQEALRQQAFQNRLALSGRDSPGLNLAAVGAPGLLLGAPGVIGAASGTAGSILERMQALRMGQATTTQTSRLRAPDQTAQILTGLGSAALIGGGIFASRFSSARFKRDIEPLDKDEYERARRSVAKTPVVRFKYRWEGRDEPTHLGIVIETSPPDVSRDGLTLDVPGYLGLTLAAVKGVDRRVDRLERGLARKAA